MPAKNKTRIMKKGSKADLVSAKPGDWVVHAAGAPQKVYAVGPAIKDLQVQLEKKGIAPAEVEIYQIPAEDAQSFLGGGELQFLLQ